jgi:hypothetical protein
MVRNVWPLLPPPQNVVNPSEQRYTMWSGVVHRHAFLVVSVPQAVEIG